jgi:hypothetical protein
MLARPGWVRRHALLRYTVDSDLNGSQIFPWPHTCLAQRNRDILIPPACRESLRQAGTGTCLHLHCLHVSPDDTVPDLEILPIACQTMFLLAIESMSYYCCYVTIQPPASACGHSSRGAIGAADSPGHLVSVALLKQPGPVLGRSNPL